MRGRVSLFAFLAIFIASGFVIAPAHAQATRTWVSGVGDDANPCSRTAPCKTFAGAISKTATNGIINCIDPGGFGAVTITKSITIDCTQTLAGISASGTNGINISGAGIVVIIRGLDIEGTVTGLIGVNFINGSAVHLENCRIYGFNSGTARGVSFAVPTGVNATLSVHNCIIEQNGTSTAGAGVFVSTTGTGLAKFAISNSKVANNTNGVATSGGGSADLRGVVSDSKVLGNTINGISASSSSSFTRVMVERTAVVSNGVGVLADGTAGGVLLSNSTVTSNTTGLSTTNNGQIFSFKNNNLNGNISSDGAPSSFLVPN